MKISNICFRLTLLASFLIASGSASTFAITAIPPSAALNNVSTANPGFRLRVVQADSPSGLTNTIDRAEQQLAGTLIDPATALPFTNVADLSGADADGYFNADGVINYSTSRGGFAGSFTPDEQMPGLPGQVSDPNQPVANVAMELLTYLDLKTGAYRFGVDATDGFSVSAQNPSASALFLAQSETPGETDFDFSVSKEGFYSFRFVFVHGAGEGSIELFSVDPETEEKILLNDPTDDRSVKAYRPDASAAVVALTPEVNAEGVAANTIISATIAHSPSNLDTNTIHLTLDGVAVPSTTISGSDTNYTQVSYQPSAPLPDGNHSASLVFGPASDTLTTNQWSFNVGLAQDITLSISSGSNGVIISWIGGGTLQTAPTVTGDWTNVTGSGSITVSPTEPALFYRVRRP